MTNFDKCYKVIYEQYKDKELILIKETDRYDVGMIKWKFQCSMSYVQDYSVVDGVKRDNFIKKEVLSVVKHWEHEVKLYSEKLKEVTESASKYINVKV